MDGIVLLFPREIVAGCLVQMARRNTFYFLRSFCPRLFKRPVNQGEENISTTSDSSRR